MDVKPFAEASRELGARFTDLLESLSALRTLSNIDVQSLTEAALLREALRALMRHRDMARCSAYLVEGERLVNVTGLDWDDMDDTDPSPKPPSWAPTEFPMGEGIVGIAAETGQLQHCRDCGRDARFIALSHQRPDTLPGALVCAPIKLSGTILGVVNISHPDTNFFNEWHERLLLLFCDFLAQLLVNSRLLHIMEGAVDRRTAQLEKTLQEAVALKRKYEELSFVDDLTHLHNRRFFFLEAEAALSRALRYETPFCLIMIDVDHFKQVNDRYGHAKGDQVLRKIAEALLEEARDSDIVARIGGEEFALGIPDTSALGCRQLAQRLADVIRELAWSGEMEALSVTISAGVACLPKKRADAETFRLDRLLRLADQALYHSKQSGRNQISVYADDVL